MTDRERLDAIRAREQEATEGPWERGDRQHVAGVLPEQFGEGRCAFCRMGEPTWVGRRSINGKRMLAHVHTQDKPYIEWGIYALREDGSVIVVNDTYEYGLMDDADAEFIAHAREDVPWLLKEVEQLTRAVEAVREYASRPASNAPADRDRLPEFYRHRVLRALEGATE